MPFAEAIGLIVAAVRVVPELVDTIRIWAEKNHEPTEQEIADLEQRYEINSKLLREKIDAAKARLAAKEQPNP